VARARRTAQRLAGENHEPLLASRHEALTDALTGLGNRRGLMADLRDASGEVMLALFDLDGFKNYNDSFGHGAGDALLARLGERLAETMDGVGAGYRMGGDEFIRRDTVVGERIVRAAPSLAHAAELVRSHHERHDGTGYPDGLRGDQIPLGGRIIAVSDAFDAMTTDRPYHAAIPADEALAELRRCSGTQFDPQVVEAFVAALAAVTLG
jgi:GGDEF domain-containing protein